jgi:hypothetical protein
MAEKRVAVFLKDGSSVVSENLEEDAAQAEFDRIVAERPGTGFAGKIIKVGKSAAFRSGDFTRIEVQDAQGPILA